MLTMDMLYLYLGVGAVYMIINAIAAGVIGADWEFKDFKFGLFWPLTLAVLFGMVLRITFEYIKEK